LEFIEAFEKKKAQKKQLKEEENKRVKERIAQKLGVVTQPEEVQKENDSQEKALINAEKE
jgi:hypothetical protein